MPKDDAHDLFIDRLARSITSASTHNPNDAHAPAAILWTDEGRHWEPIVGRLRKAVPHLLVLGSYDPDALTGPAIWLRCAVDGALDEPLSSDEPAVVYLPGVSRQDLGSPDTCPDSLKPLVELQYRGTCWTQKNGKDWTVEAFLTSADGGLGLDVARDGDTRQAIPGCLAELADTSIGQLTGRRIDANFLHGLLSDDPARDMLTWLNDAETTRRGWSAARWRAFSSQCVADLAFDPEKEGVIAGAERLGRREGQWASIWRRFEEAPSLYPALPETLRNAKPQDVLAEPSSWPQNNDDGESALRKAFAQLATKTPAQARDTILKLEASDAERRNWVWATLGDSPLAFALEYLAALARRTSNQLGGASIDEMAELYAKGAWQVDAAALDAMDAVKSSADANAVSSALRAIYQPWLEAAAAHLQRLAAATPLPGNSAQSRDDVSVDAGGVVLFADGLRFDVSQRLVAGLEADRRTVSVATRWAGLPTVTATAKPAVSPVADLIDQASLGDDFQLGFGDDGNPLTSDRFRKLLHGAGYEYVRPGETGDPTGKAWTEDGNLDKQGHNLQDKLANHVDDQVALLVERVNDLLEAGWQEVRIVTDHGWLWLPGGLPKADLPKYLTGTRWTRCATIQGESNVAVPVVPWHWNAEHRVAVAPGISCFGAGNAYAHGGVSLQECLIPVIRVTGGAGTAKRATIKQVSWAGLRCRVTVGGGASGLSVDLRTHAGNAGSSVSRARLVDDQGSAGLLVADDDLEGASAIVVVIDQDGNVLARQSTIIGGEG